MNYMQLVFPLFLLLACGAHFLSWKRFPKGSSRLVSLCLAAVFLMSWPPVAWLLSGSLEWWYATDPVVNTDAGAIVVLSGAAWPAGPFQPYDLPRDSTVARCRHGAFLHSRWKTLPVIASGGQFSRGDSKDSVADLMATLLQGWSVPRELLRTESRSRSTHEQAVHTAEMLRGTGVRSVLLVTEAYHMLRAEGCFRKAGFRVIPAPCGFRAADFELKISKFLPSHDAIRLNEEALREWAAIAWYKYRGRI